MNDRSFELSANSVLVYVRVHVYCSREYDVLSIFVHIHYTVVACFVSFPDED